MPKITEVKVRFGFTKNEGNYESSRCDVELVGVITAKEDHDSVVNDLLIEAEEKVYEFLGVKHD